MRSFGPESVPWWIAGNSLGGLLALQVACRAPTRVERITLAALALPLHWGRRRVRLGAARNYIALAAPGVGRRLIARYVRETGVPGVVDDPIRMLFHDPARLDSAFRQRLIEVSERRMSWVEEAARAYEHSTLSLGLRLVSPVGAVRWIRGVRCPVRSIRGSHDPLYPQAAWERLEGLRPDWDHVCLDGVGHVPQLEVPERFAERMIREIG